MKDEQAFLREQFKEESILWWGKPSVKHTLRVEKRIICTCISGIVITTIGLMLPPYGIKGFLISISLCSPMYIFILYQLVRWPIRKKNTYFVLTDKRAAVLYRKNRKWNEITKPYESMFHCDVQQKKKCCHIELGDYRYGFDTPYNYKTRKFECIEYNFDTKMFDECNKNFFYDEKYFCFFDLTDCSVPVGIIKEKMRSYRNRNKDA